MSSQPPREDIASHQPSPKPFSMSLSSSSTSKKPTFTVRQPKPAPSSRRTHHLHTADSDSDPEDTAPAHEAVTTIDTATGTAVSESQPQKQDLVIPVSSGNNWRSRPGVNNVRRGGTAKTNLLPKEVQAMQEARARGEHVEGQGRGELEREGPSVKYGLSFAESRDGDSEMKDAPASATAAADPIIPPVVEEKKPLTQDELAMQALIRESKGESEGRSDLVIQAAPRPAEEEEENGQGQYDETSSFRADVAARPESATLDQYNSIPVEDFGAALLRGMGWKEGQSVGRGNYDTSATAKRAHTPRVPERRPGFLGIGAKDISGGKGAESEIGAWGKAAMRKGSRKNEKEGGETNTEGVYMPVMMRNTQTGEHVTEEELAVLRKEAKAKKDGDDWRGRRDRNLERSGRDRDRDRDYRRRDYEDGDRRNGSSRRDRSRSSDRYSSRRRRYDDDEVSSGRDDRSYRERERRHDRDRDRERDRDKDRERKDKYRDHDTYSSRHSSSRHRDRSRDRDSDRGSHRRRR